MLRVRRRFEEIVAIDFFTSPFRSNAEEALAQAEQTGMKPSLSKKGSASKAKYQRRTWITRPRPGIDRVSSAWLISRFINASPKFITQVCYKSLHAGLSLFWLIESWTRSVVALRMVIGTPAVAQSTAPSFIQRVS